MLPWCSRGSWRVVRGDKEQLQEERERGGAGAGHKHGWMIHHTWACFFYIKIYLNGKKNNNNNKITRKEITRKHTSVCLWRESRKTKNKRKR